MGFPAQLVAGIVEGYGPFPGHEGGPFVDDEPLQGGIWPKLGKEVPDGVYVKATAGNVFRPRIVSPLQEKNLHPLIGQGVGGGQARQARPHHNDVDFFHDRRSPPVVPDFTCATDPPV